MARFQEQKLEYERDPVLLWVALICVFALLVAILGLSLGHSMAQRRAEMLSFVTSYQLVSADQDVARRPVRVILAQ
jgi:hypothetical protein